MRALEKLNIIFAEHSCLTKLTINIYRLIVWPCLEPKNMTSTPSKHLTKINLFPIKNNPEMMCFNSIRRIFIDSKFNTVIIFIVYQLRGSWSF